MGCGKTTLGTAVAQLAGTQLIDLDEYIEQSYGATIRQIFERDGESYFRQLERECLEQVAKMQGILVACGGGTPCFGDNMDIMNAAGITVWLTASPRRIASRLVIPEQKAKRPIIAQLSNSQLLAHVKTGLAAREPFYSHAQIQFDSTRLETEQQVAATARRFIKTMQSIGVID